MRLFSLNNCIFFFLISYIFLYNNPISGKPMFERVKQWFPTFFGLLQPYYLYKYLTAILDSQIGIKIKELY